jgi:NAD(P)H-binding
MERIVVGSGLDWTIARLNRLTNKAAGGTVHTSCGLLAKPRAIARADAAAVLLDVVADPTLAGTAINVAGG